jgi:dihydropteroate synthase
VIPDELGSLDSMVDTMEFLDAHRIPFRLDPVLEPLGLGLVASLDRYLEARRRWPNAEMLMGVGNLTELSDVDSAGVNFILMGICQELGIRSVLTTQVINWARSSIAECDVARRIARYACTRRMPAKHISHQLVVLRDARLLEFGEAAIVDMAAKIKDANYRIFVSEHKIHLLGSGEHFTSTDVFELFDQLVSTEPGNLDPSHSFYLGYELCKASISLQLGKNYIQDESLDWGHLTVPEQSRHRLSRRKH